MSATAADSEFERDLRRLFTHVRRNARNPTIFLEAEIVGLGGKGRVAIVGEALPLFRLLKRRLAGPSHTASGISPKDAHNLLLDACKVAVSGTVRDAISSLCEGVSAPTEAILVAHPANVLMTIPKLTIGHVTYLKEIPKAWHSERGIPRTGLKDQLKAPVVTTTVEARSYDTARFIAQERFAESRAILELVSGQLESDDQVVFVRSKAGGGLGWHGGRGLVSGSVVAGTRLVPPFLHLSRAAARPEDRQTDWERRVLAATRWYSRARRSYWAADGLASTMVALEALFVAGRKESYKGSLIAERMTDRFKLNEMTADQQKIWLRELYQRRNDAVHEGRSFANDLEVERLLDLSGYALRGLASLLAPDSSSGRRASRTFDEAMAASVP